MVVQHYQGALLVLLLVLVFNIGHRYSPTPPTDHYIAYFSACHPRNHVDGWSYNDDRRTEQGGRAKRFCGIITSSTSLRHVPLLITLVILTDEAITLA
jgi:hypothetical protein